MSKVIFLDFGIFSHRAGFATQFNPMGPGRTCYNMMLSNLKLIGVDKDDIIIIACDGRHNWRKDYDKSYKSTRSQKLVDSGIDWTEVWRQCNLLLEQIEQSTNWHVIKIDRLEADDIMAVGTRYFWNKDIVLVTYDSDLEQMWHYNIVSKCCKAPLKVDNSQTICLKCEQSTEEIKVNRVKIFSPHSKLKRYKPMPENFNVYEVLSRKVKKEKTDDLVAEVLNEDDFNIRNQLINLINLPNWVKILVKKELVLLNHNKIIHYNSLPFSNLRKDRWGRSGIDNFNLIYNKDKVITYEDSIKYVERKKKRMARKKRKNYQSTIREIMEKGNRS